MITQPSPSFFFIAHVLLKYGTANAQLENFKSLVPTAKSVFVVKSDTKLYQTFVATFAEQADFPNIRVKLNFYYAAKSKVLAVHHSTMSVPTYFYSAHLIQNYPLKERHNGTVTRGQDLVRAAVALATPFKKDLYTLHESTVLVESPETPIRPEDVSAITTAMKKMPHIALLSSVEL